MLLYIARLIMSSLFLKIELPQFEVFPRIVNETTELVSVECQVTDGTVADLCWLTGDNVVISKDSADVSVHSGHLCVSAGG